MSVHLCCRRGGKSADAIRSVNGDISQWRGRRKMGTRAPRDPAGPQLIRTTGKSSLYTYAWIAFGKVIVLDKEPARGSRVGVGATRVP
jgi:hypothetical protein